MNIKILLLMSLFLLIAALSATDAEIVRNLEFYESMDAIASDDQTILERFSEVPEEDVTDEENLDEN